MPKVYKKLRDDFIKKGMPESAAKTKAAKIYNYLRSKKPSMQKLTNKGDK